jgi:hypothetical protein
MRTTSWWASLLLGMGFVASTVCSAASVPLENSRFLISYDEDSARFSVTDKSSGLAFIKAAKAEMVAGKAQREVVSDPVFGAGQRIRVERGAGGGSVSIELYESLPFVLIRGELRASGSQSTDLKSVQIAELGLNLDKPASVLRTMGTAGLTSPESNPGSYLFLTLADPSTRRGIVTGWLTAERGGGVIFSEVSDSQVRFKTRIDYGRLQLKPGDTATLETFAVGFFEDARLGQESFAEAIARQHQIRLRPQPAGYCTWYSNPHGGAADERAIIELGEFVARELKPFGMSVVQIDDKWQDGAERNGPARRFLRAKPDGPYPHGMEPVARRFQELGLTAGLWFLPFASDYLDPEFKDRQDWFARRLDGKPYETPWGNTSLDLTRPDVHAYLAEIARAIHGWGYNYFKMDGLWTGTASEQIYVNDGYRDDHLGANAPFYDPFKTNLEALRDGLKLLRRAAGPDVFFSGCNVSQNMRTLGGCIGLLDSMRIGPDNGPGWAEYRQEIAGNGCGSIITGPIRGTRLYFLNGRTWWNDPDPSYVRATIPIHHARLITSWVALSGQFYLNSDWIPGLPPERLDIIKRTIPAHSATARPVDYFDSMMPRIWIVTDVRAVRRDVLGLYNWEKQPETIRCDALRAGLDPAKTYFGFDFWSNAPVPLMSASFEFNVPGQSCRVIALRAAEGHPVLASTSRHVTQGIVDVVSESWSDGALFGTSKVVGGDPYELRIAGLNDAGANWTPVSATATGAVSEDVTVAMELARATEPGWARVRIHSARTQDVHWTIRFEK